MKGLFIPEITAEMFRNGCLESIEALMAEGEIYDIDYSPWIPCSERLPKIADVYRVTRYYPNNVMNPKYLVDSCAFDGSDTWYNDNRINHERAYADNVIAWQENPEPYKAEKPETCKGCLEPCIMYEPDMRACKKKVTERGE